MNKLKVITPAGWLLIILGTITWSLTMVKSGLVYDYGAGFWGPNGHDGIWHIAIARGLASGTWEIPIFVGENIKNYHIGFDLLLAMLHKITFIPLSILYFQILPPIMAILVGVSVYKFVNLWKKSKLVAFWATFFVYFSGSFGWLITLVRNKSIDGESIFWAQQSISTLINPPFALSLVLTFFGLYLLKKYLENQESLKVSEKNLAILVILFGILVQTKIYASILVLGGLFVAGLIRMLRRKGTLLFKIFSGSLIVSMLLFLPLYDRVESTIIFKPFWFIETMMSFSDRVGWSKFGEAMVNYKTGGVWLKAIPAYGLAFIIFLLGNMGIRIISLSYIFKSIKSRKFSYLDIIFYSVIVGGIVAPTFFVQSGTAWNTIQFFYYSLTLLAVLAGIEFGNWLTCLNKKDLKYKNVKVYPAVLLFVVVAFAVPTIYSTLRHYLPMRPPAMISNEELEALRFLEEQEDGIVIKMPFNRELASNLEIKPPRPLYVYESTAYISAYSGQKVYMEDEVNLEITGYDWRGRRESIGKFFLAATEEEANAFLKDNNIKYFYWHTKLYGPIREDQNLVKNIFENSEIIVYETIIK